MWQVGIDVGGTFTDLFAIEGTSGKTAEAKVLTTPRDRSIGVFDALNAAAIPISEVEALVHGSTTATNALVERSYPPLAMITTEGFRDVIEIGRQRRPDLFDLHQQRPKPIVPRRRRFTVPGRIAADGTELVGFDEAAALKLAQQLKEMEIISVAICFINAYAHPSHEERMRDILLSVYPECFVALSSATVPKLREHGRFTTTAIRAALLPVMGRYFDALHSGLLNKGFAGTLLVLKSNGGMMGVDLAREKPEELLESGPAGGAAYARSLSETTEFRKIIHTDMGGTTFDASIVEDGKVLITTDYEVEWEMPVTIPMLDIRSVGAGGGSIAWIDAGGSLRVGPRSSGADPGPACYGRGGTEATVTDANLLLGRLDPTLGGKFTLDEVAAKRVVTRIAEQIGLSILEAAEAIISITCENMAQAIKMVLIDRGRDPRDFVLASFGGAGAMHACFIARSMNIPRIIVPTYAGVASAYGAIAMDIRHDLEAFYYASVNTIDFAHLNRLYDGLEEQGRQLLARDGVTPENMTFSRRAQMRYTGQFWEVLTPIMGGELGPGSVPDLKEAFHKAHETEHGVCTRSFPMEFVNIGVSATGRSKVPVQVSRRARDDTAAQVGIRPVYFSGRWYDVPVMRGDRLSFGAKVVGPAIIDYPHFGTVLPPDTTAVTDEMDNLVISVA